MALSTEALLQLDYDARGDVLYASLGAPQPAVSYEIDEDIYLRHVPPSHDVVGITILNFLQHFPLEDRAPLQQHAARIVHELLQKYRSVPAD